MNQYSGINPIQQKQHKVYNSNIQPQPQLYNYTGVQQTSQIDRHLVNFGQPSPSRMPSITKNNIKTEHDNVGTNSTTRTDKISKSNMGTSMDNFSGGTMFHDINKKNSWNSDVYQQYIFRTYATL